MLEPTDVKETSGAEPKEMHIGMLGGKNKVQKQSNVHRSDYLQEEMRHDFCLQK